MRVRYGMCFVSLIQTVSLSLQYCVKYYVNVNHAVMKLICNLMVNSLAPGRW